MCLIAYVRAGATLPETHIRAAAHDNSDGIGIMSIDGVEKFLGRKAIKRALRHIKRLHDAGMEYAIHFRFATHGTVNLANCHPFKMPDGSAYVMHNGIMGAEYQPKSKYGAVSDTRLFVESFADRPMGDFEDTEYWQKMAAHIGTYNKLCLMSWDGRFKIVNEYSGDWIDNVWYSQTYSLPGCGYSRSYEVDTTGRGNWSRTYREGGNGTTRYLGYGGYENAAYDGYGRIVQAALDRRLGSAEGAQHTHSVPSDTYSRGMTTMVKTADGEWITQDELENRSRYGLREIESRGADDDARLDAELDRHLRDEGNFICASCESISYVEPELLAAHDGRVQCPECGYIDMSDGMLDGYQVAAK